MKVSLLNSHTSYILRVACVKISRRPRERVVEPLDDGRLGTTVAFSIVVRESWTAPVLFGGRALLQIWNSPLFEFKKKKTESTNRLVAIARSFYCMAGNNALRVYESGEKKLLSLI